MDAHQAWIKGQLSADTSEQTVRDFCAAAFVAWLDVQRAENPIDNH